MRLTEEQMIQSRIETAVSEAIKEQMERIKGLIDKEINRAREGIKATTDGFWRGYWVGIEQKMEALKSQLEGE